MMTEIFDVRKGMDPMGMEINLNDQQLHFLAIEGTMLLLARREGMMTPELGTNRISKCLLLEME